MLTKIYSFLHRLSARPEERGEYSSGYWQDMVRVGALNLCRDLSAKLLEVGCGEGLFLAQLAAQNQNIEIYGIDNNQVLLEKAQRRCQEKSLSNIHLSLEDAIGLSFEDEYFDAVVCLNVIFNLGSRDTLKKVLYEMARVCKKRGKVIVDFRNGANPFLWLKYLLAPWYDATVKDLPLKTYRLNDLQSILEAAGFQITNKISLGFPVKAIAPIIILEATKL